VDNKLRFTKHYRSIVNEANHRSSLALKLFQSRKPQLLFIFCLNGLAPPYLACEFRRAADTESRQRLRSASTAELIIARVRRETIGGRAFPGRGCKSMEQSTIKSDIIIKFESFQVWL